MDKDEALDLALEALEESHPEAYRQVITALRTAIEQAEKQEPVAVVSGYYGGQCVVLPINPARLFNSGTAFYTTPPAAQRQFVGLTDEEISDIAINNPPMVHEFARAIEQCLKEKNT